MIVVWGKGVRDLDWPAKEFSGVWVARGSEARQWLPRLAELTGAQLPVRTRDSAIAALEDFRARREHAERERATARGAV
jgi:hypothetical protein